MKQKKQTEKKLSLRKLQMAKVNNPHTIKGGDNDMPDIEKNNNDGDRTGTGKTK